MDGAGYPVTFGTFHGVYYGILKWAYGLTSANILTEEEKYQMIRQILDSPEPEMDMDIQMSRTISGIYCQKSAE